VLRFSHHRCPAGRRMTKVVLRSDEYVRGVESMDCFGAKMTPETVTVDIKFGSQ
jgi:hypothetical protein